MYKLLRNILFLSGPEWVHYFSMNCLKLLCKIPGVKGLIAKAFTPDIKANGQWAIGNRQLKNPVGMPLQFQLPGLIKLVFEFFETCFAFHIIIAKAFEVIIYLVEHRNSLAMIGKPRII